MEEFQREEIDRIYSSKVRNGFALVMGDGFLIP